MSVNEQVKLNHESSHLAQLGNTRTNTYKLLYVDFLTTITKSNIEDHDEVSTEDTLTFFEHFDHV